MHRRLSSGFFALVIVLTVPQPLRADAPGVYAITGGTVHPVSGAEIPNGTVVIRDGLIEAVGAGISIPADATTVDVKGGHIYPGLIDAQTSLGFPAPATRTRGRGGGGGARPQTPAAELPETNAAFIAARTAKLRFSWASRRSSPAQTWMTSNFSARKRADTPKHRYADTFLPGRGANL